MHRIMVSSLLAPTSHEDKPSDLHKRTTKAMNLKLLLSHVLIAYSKRLAKPGPAKPQSYTWTSTNVFFLAKCILSFLDSWTHFGPLADSTLDLGRLDIQRFTDSETLSGLIPLISQLWADSVAKLQSIVGKAGSKDGLQTCLTTLLAKTKTNPLSSHVTFISTRTNFDLPPMHQPKLGVGELLTSVVRVGMQSARTDTEHETWLRFAEEAAGYLLLLLEHSRLLGMKEAMATLRQDFATLFQIFLRAYSDDKRPNPEARQIMVTRSLATVCKLLLFFSPLPQSCSAELLASQFGPETGSQSKPSGSSLDAHAIRLAQEAVLSHAIRNDPQVAHKAAAPATSARYAVLRSNTRTEQEEQKAEKDRNSASFK